MLVIVPDEAEAETVRRIFKLYVGGLSMTKIAERLGLKLDRVKDALHRRVYTGEIQNARGEWIRGKHEAIIAPDLFVRAHRGAHAPRAATTRSNQRNEHMASS